MTLNLTRSEAEWLTQFLTRAGIGPPEKTSILAKLEEGQGG